MAKKKTAAKKRKRPAGVPPGVEIGADGEPVYLTKSEFERWIKTQGITIAHSNLYKIYLGPTASNPVIYNGDRSKVHKWKSLEIIRMVKERSVINPEKHAERRREADIRLAEAKSKREEIALQTERGERVFVVQVEKKWEQLIQKLKNGLRNVENSLPAEVRNELRQQHHELLHSLSTSFRPTQS